VTANSETSPRPLIVGTNHTTGNLSLRDRLFVEDSDVPTFLDMLKANGLDQATVMSTCDRVDVATFAHDIDAAVRSIQASLAQHADLDMADLDNALYVHADQSAIKHLFRVASSLDSVVVGEPQVLGQLKACHRMARDHEMICGHLDSLFQASYSVAKRVRSETAIGERPVSIASVAIGITRDVHGDLGRVDALTLGNGDMGEVIAREMMRAGVVNMSVADVGPRSAQDLARRMDVPHVMSEKLSDALARADVVISAVGGREKHLSADMVRAALKARRYRPQFIVDAALPGDVEPAVDRLDDAFLYDLGDLERLAMEGLQSRESEAANAESIVDEEVAAFLKGKRERSAVPALVSLREHVAILRDEALAEAGSDAEKATHLLMQKMLHAPSERLRKIAADGGDIEGMEKMIERLFDLNNDGDNKS